MLVYTIFLLSKVNQENVISLIYAGAICKLTNKWYFTILQWNQLSKE